MGGRLERAVVGAAMVWGPASLAAAGGPERVVAVEAPWRVVHEDDEGITVALGTTPRGVRIQWAWTDRRPGVTVVEGGRTITAGAWPMVALPYPDHPPTRCEIRSEGPDLVVRIAGPPIALVLTHPEAPDDPVVTWVRLRPRPDDWRIVLDGSGVVTVPGATRSAPHPRGGLWVGESLWESDAPEVRSWLDGDGIHLDTTPSLGAFAPYERSALTWRPASSR